jgi:hypothetical protein
MVNWKKGLGGNDHVLIKVLFWNLRGGTEEINEMLHSGRLMSQPRFEVTIS